MAYENPEKDLKRDLEKTEPTRASFLPEDVPDPVETRDPASEPVPVHKGRAFLFAVPVLVLALIGLVWFLSSERGGTQDDGGPIGTTGAASTEAHRTDSDALPRGDEAPLYGEPQIAVVSSMAHLLGKDEYVGRPVEIAGIPVSDVKGPRTFEVGRLTNRTLVVVDGDASIVPSLERGELVRLSGRLESSGSAQPPAGLNEDERDALSGADVFILATLVQHQQDAGADQAATPEMERTVPQPEREE